MKISTNYWWEEEFLEGVQNFKEILIFIAVSTSILTVLLSLFYDRINSLWIGSTIMAIIVIGAAYLFCTIEFENKLILAIPVAILIKIICGILYLASIYTISTEFQVLFIFQSMTIYIYIEFKRRKKSFESYAYIKKLEFIKKRLEIILHAFPEGLLVLSRDLHIEYINMRFCNLLNCDEQGALKILSNLEYDSDKKFFNNLTESNLLIDDIKECFNLMPNQEKILGIAQYSYMSLEWKINKIEWGNDEAVLITARNVTHVIELEKNSAENRCKIALIRSLSHELRTPTANIINFTNQVIDEIGNISEELQEKLQCICVSSKILLYLICDLLDFSQITQSIFSANKHRFNVHGIFNELYDIFRVVAKRKNLDLILRIDPELPEFGYSDSLRIKQIIVNFLNNAIKYTSKGTIEICALLSQEGKLKVMIKDSGIGIPEERLSQLFKIFSSVYSSDVTSQGCGLGLHISNLLLNKLGGSSISVESISGKGTTIGFDLEIFENVPSFESHEEDPLVPDENPSIKKIKLNIYNKKKADELPEILIVDDIEFNRAALASILDANRIPYIEAEDGKEAALTVQRYNSTEKPLKLVIMDCGMPVMDGWQSTKEIKHLFEEGKIKHMPHIIGYSAFTSDEDIKMCYAAGMTSYISKPASKELILEIVKQYVE
ncbi:unnamed protein product [Blepharisma stoltei]|uniref:Histidine kinase n=1 Tax=Blepharisma stoltei TaxID=1481888 RepID=A0AAU9K8B1_9CILI|nr:unnamed protein product [Blepharisma stoltei]